MNRVTDLNNGSNWSNLKTAPKEVENKNPYYNKILASGIFDSTFNRGIKLWEGPFRSNAKHFDASKSINGNVLTISADEKADIYWGPDYLGEIKPRPGLTRLVITVEDYSGNPWNTKIGFVLTDKAGWGKSKTDGGWFNQDDDDIPVNKKGKAYNMHDKFIADDLEPEHSGLQRGSVLIYDISKYAFSGESIHLGAKIKMEGGSKMQFRFELK
ncbi:MAG: hypothetical protein LBQ83_04060 [Candidatus Margulisbacteria bacterium]|jgi:hypothetical protein|nr:hypothetical protein [Candidatus Margulisiibacteriota bacterium]